MVPAHQRSASLCRETRTCIELFFDRRYPMPGGSQGKRNDKESSAMNAFVFSLKTGNIFSGALLLVPHRTILLPALLLIFVCHPIAVGQSDDFNDGDDNGWVRYNPLGTATFSFTKHNFGGKDYRIQ